MALHSDKKYVSRGEEGGGDAEQGVGRFVPGRAANGVASLPRCLARGVGSDWFPPRPCRCAVKWF